MNIHPTALVDSGAEIGDRCEIGPWSVIEAEVVLGEGCRVGPHVHLRGPMVIGRENRIHTGCVLGDDPQDFKFQNQPTRLVIGDRNVFREHVTIHRSNSLEEDTVIGDRNYFMASSHVGHNSRIGNDNVFVNGALVAGHVILGNHCIVSGNAMIHQFVRVGSFAMMQGGAAISKDLPPFCMASRQNRMAGLNTVGLRRNGFSPAERTELRELYRFLFMQNLPWEEKLPRAWHRYTAAPSVRMLEFVSGSSRGVCAHGRD